MSAPYSIGATESALPRCYRDQRAVRVYGNGARRLISQMFPAGLPTLSQKTARVFFIDPVARSRPDGRKPQSGSDSLARQDMAEERMGGAVELRNRNDIASSSLTLSMAY